MGKQTYVLEQFITERYAKKQDGKDIDAVTGLLKYSVFIKEAQYYIRNRTRDKQLIAYYMDIKNFKLVNEFYGVQGGDALLQAISHFMLTSSRKGLCGRFFSDNFVKIFEANDDEPIEDVQVNLKNELANLIIQQSNKYPKANLGIAIGLYAIKPEEQGIIQIIDKANSARKSIKSRKLIDCSIYNQKLENAIYKKQQLEIQLKQALQNKEFDFYLQPKINIETGKIVGAEALVRWIQKDGTVKEPADFLSLMEEIGTIVELDFLIYEEVFKYIQKQINENRMVVPISVNVSRKHLSDQEFAFRVHQLAVKYNVMPALIEFEITENIFIHNLENTKHLIKKLNKYGYQVSVDDFGSGFSSLNILKDLNFDVLKMDRKFISGKGYDSKKNKTIMSSVIEMAKKLHMGVVLEGVETKSHIEMMKSLGCSIAQGYYFDRPLEKEEFTRHIEMSDYYRELLLDNQGHDGVTINNSKKYKDIEDMTVDELSSIVNRLFETIPFGIIGINVYDGSVLFTNNKVFEIAGYSKEKTIKNNTRELHKILKLKDIMQMKNMDVNQELLSKGKFYNEYPIINKNGKTIYIRVTGGYASSREWGNFLLCTVYDISNEYEVRKEVEQSQRTMDDILKSIHGGVARLVITDKYRVEFGSDGFYELCGYNRLKSLLNPFYNRFRNIIYHEDIKRVREITEKIIKGQETQIEHRIYRGDGSVAWVEGHVSKVYKRDQEVIIEVFYIDTTNQRNAEEKERKFYTSVYDSVLCGIIQYEEIDGKFNGINANSEAVNILGYTDRLKEFWKARVPDMIGFLHPDDREEYLEKLKSLKQEGDIVNFEHRILKMDGTISWLQGAAKKIRDQEDRLIIQSTFFDSTYYLQQQRKFEENYRQIAKIMKQTFFEYEVGRDLLTFAINDADNRLGLPKKIENYRQKQEAGMLYGMVQPLTKEEYENEAKSDIVVNIKRKCVSITGAICWLKISFFVIRDNQGIAKTYIGTIMDVTQEEIKNKELKQLAHRDQLTGLYNKTTFKKRVIKYIQEDGKNHTKVLLFIDLDNFKTANDTFGHAFGDKLLVGVGEVIKKVFRQGDICGRLGGDEFAILMKNVTDTKIVEEKAKRLNYEILRRSTDLGFSKGTCSIGVTIEPAGQDDYEQIVANGDTAMYKAKETGKATYYILDATK